MNIEKITYKILEMTLINGEMNPFIMKMMISYLTDEQRGAILDEIVNELPSIEFKKGDAIWFDSKDNKYDLKDLIQEDMMKDAKLMDEYGFIKGEIISDCSYRDECNPYATEYKVKVNFHALKGSKTTSKEIRVKRSNILALWKPLE